MLRIKQDSQTSVLTQEQGFVPLKQVNVEATIRSFAADVTITQIFRNDEKQPIEAVYCFPIEEQAAIYSFTARIDDREIVAQLKEKKEAQQEYNNALQQGHGAYLLEQDENSQDNFIINVGALPSSKECTITIAYVTELDFVQGSIIRFVVPTTIAPRYNPDKGSIASPAGTNSKYVQSTPYTIDFRCRIDKMGRSQEEYIARINSPSHPIQIDFAQQDAYVITFAQQNTHLDRDILINIELTDKRVNTIVAVESSAIMAAFIPTEEDCRQGLNNDQINEFIFIVDCSGSMQDENKIGLARQAMLVFLKSLPIDCHFNIIRFGTQYKSLFTEITAIYNEENAQKAEQLINGMKADLGGTELMGPLQWIEQHSPNQGRARQIFLLTDGEISNVTEVLDLCRSMALSTRIFSFGLGKSPSRSLVKGLARSTNGRFVFVPPNSSVDVYVGEQLQRALQPCITNIRVNWNLGVTVQTAPKQSPPVYFNDRLIVYALTNDKTIPFDHNSSVELQIEPDHRSIGIAKVNQIPSVANNETIARLAAKALILELQHAKLPSSTAKKPKTGSTQARFQNLVGSDEEKMEVVPDEQTTKQRIIELSLKYNILSPHTAFVGIEKRTNASNADMVLREVPIEISADDQHLFTPSRLHFLGGGGGGAIRHSASYRFSPGGGFRGRGATTTVRNLQTRPNIQTLDAAISDFSVPMELSSRLSAKRMEGDRSSLYRRPIHIDAENIVRESRTISQNNEVWPSTDQDIVRYLINKQKFNGLWNLDDDIIKKLTGKSLSSFQSANPNIDNQILISVIVIIILETRFAGFSSLWHGVVQKARKRLIDLVKKDSKDFDTLLDDIRKQL
ncbi:unnamed protein product [Rotaria sordida]|uniref:Uncharacterized protein n=1 Tax=Rotaria sordida TaxID=392033 RepID=A0A819D4D0_9BILA|nr:unnamed protein product [Rotaria sordida]